MVVRAFLEICAMTTPLDTKNNRDKNIEIGPESQFIKMPPDKEGYPAADTMEAARRSCAHLLSSLIIMEI